MRLRPARIGVASPNSTSSPASSTQPPTIRFPGRWMMMASAETAPYPPPTLLFTLSAVSSQHTPPLLDNSPTSPPKTQILFFGQARGFPSLRHCQDFSATPSTCSSFSLQLQTSLSTSFLHPARPSHILQIEAPPPEGWLGSHCTH